MDAQVRRERRKWKSQSVLLIADDFQRLDRIERSLKRAENDESTLRSLPVTRQNVELRVSEQKTPDSTQKPKNIFLGWVKNAQGIYERKFRSKTNANIQNRHSFIDKATTENPNWLRVPGSDSDTERLMPRNKTNLERSQSTKVISNRGLLTENMQRLNDIRTQLRKSRESLAVICDENAEDSEEQIERKFNDNNRSFNQDYSRINHDNSRVNNDNSRRRSLCVSGLDNVVLRRPMTQSSEKLMGDEWLKRRYTPRDPKSRPRSWICGDNRLEAPAFGAHSIKLDDEQNQSPSVSFRVPKLVEPGIRSPEVETGNNLPRSSFQERFRACDLALKTFRTALDHLLHVHSSVTKDYELTTTESRKLLEFLNSAMQEGCSEVDKAASLLRGNARSFNDSSS